jgi:hypothetical protein
LTLTQFIAGAVGAALVTALTDLVDARTALALIAVFPALSAVVAVQRMRAAHRPRAAADRLPAAAPLVPIGPRPSH